MPDFIHTSAAVLTRVAMRGACVLAMALAPLLAGSQAATFAQVAPAATPDLAQQEIQLLKRRLAEAQVKLAEERTGRVVYETQAEVAALRGFWLLEPVDYKPLTKERLVQILDESIARQYPGKSLEYYVWLNQLFSALPEPFDMLQYMHELTGEQVAGLYDPASAVLFVRDRFDLSSPLGRMILAHEICHALQDQNHPLQELGVEDSENSDRALAVLSIAEGDATLLMSEYLAQYGNPFSLIADLPRMMAMDQQKLNNAPPAIQQSLLFPYMQGMQFFQHLNGRTRTHPQGDRADLQTDSAWRAEVFSDPPESTEQILHPEKYLTRELPGDVELPATDDMLSSATNVLGEFGTALMFEPLLGRERARKAAQGWNGDRVRVGDAKQGGRRLVQWVARWDSEQDATEFSDALREALEARYAGALRWRQSGSEWQGRARKATFTLRALEPTLISLTGSVALDD